jgi:ADP-dependent NAD(P)H-hydrate dehydratase / NAD(P)H-hydrate epimerase
VQSNVDIVQVLPGCGPVQGGWPLHDVVSSRRAEALALAARPPQALMQQAGGALARLGLALAPQARHTAVFCGPGNNGGDGLVAATCLHRAGRSVQVFLLDNTRQRPADAALALQQAEAAGVAICTAPAAGFGSGPAADLVIDALLGIGSRNAPTGAMTRAIDAINHQPAVVLSVDLPSGLHPDTGALLGACAVRADATLSLISLKPGCFTGRGRDHAGAVWLASLGVHAGPASACLSAAPTWPHRPHAGHKGSFGDVRVVGGAPGMVGAAWLAGRAALAAGAGRVWVHLLDRDAMRLDPRRPELMAATSDGLAAPSRMAPSTVVCGCGAGDAVRPALPAVLAHAGRLVLDADALNAVATDPMLQRLLRARSTRGLPSILTPHPLEAARLLDTRSASVQADRLAAAQTLADQFGCAVLLKGSGSVVAAPGTLAQINPTGNAAPVTCWPAGWVDGGRNSPTPRLLTWPLRPPGGTATRPTCTRKAAWLARCGQTT